MMQSPTQNQPVTFSSPHPGAGGIVSIMPNSTNSKYHIKIGFIQNSMVFLTIVQRIKNKDGSIFVFLP